ncbi:MULTISPECIES: hypothetical protein [Saccharopolyspora]|uniref:DUF3558 domain-containing protein n=1 Tax=Saccharopolyspora gregorii TaxID=33914 RepID=A0ABP6S1D8_9PSEU|nr:MULTISPECIES: hypothetical protein [Saccharopolyspora]MCA1186367.1 hypothetical protein [Saccharopolyspora sp. 6T]MCA1191146.1 hypothetical protein [Saccharopolyspora sp. 6V]MCA1225724.1 hypothetical protein [Saccharopolyspora sp. 6M]MCA1278592.1 hypothetical protein [Saccharopolyspora sp. 7B]
MSPRRTSAVLVSAFSLASLAFAPAASAADEPTTRELMEKCDNGTDSCVFHPEGQPEYYVEDRHTVGDPVYNCTDGLQRFSVEWSDTTSQSNSVGLSMTTEAGFGKVFAVAYEQSYEHTWEESHTESQTTHVDTEPNQVGSVERAAQMQKVKGTYELHFEDKFHDHYIWYVPMEITGPAPDPTSAVSQHVRDMTEEEISQCP